MPALDKREYIILGCGLVLGFGLAALVGYYYQEGKYDVPAPGPIPMHGVPIAEKLNDV